jgi:hypothetical protein
VDYSLNAPRPAQLPVLIRLNVLDALARNAAMMGFPPEGLCADSFVSPFNDVGPRLPHTILPPPAFPTILAPTALQRKIQHHPWIDLFPFPRFRDNMLRALDTGHFDEDELCLDILDVNGNDLGDKPALIVWGESSDSRAWEVSVPFLRKWGWLVRGCPEILEGTNYWRGLRGEGPLLLRS